MSGVPAPPRWRLIVAIGAVLFLMLLLGPVSTWLMDAGANPWVRAKPPLLDRWGGETSTASGTAIGLELRLSRQPLDLFPQGGAVSDDGRLVGGDATLCVHGGVTRSYRIQGVVADRHARHARLTLGWNGRQAPGLTATRIDLTWPGADALGVEAQLERISPTGGTIWSSSDPDLAAPTHLDLRRGRRVCGGR